MLELSDFLTILNVEYACVLVLKVYYFLIVESLTLYFIYQRQRGQWTCHEQYTSCQRVRSRPVASVRTIMNRASKHLTNVC